MTPAEKRLMEQIERWLTSLDLHLHYADFKDSAYNNVQPWPVHDRPARMVLEVAKQKTMDLKAACESRIAMGDSKFAEALELMAFLANLVGSQNVARFIPLATLEYHGHAVKPENTSIPETPTSSTSTQRPSAPPATITQTPAVTATLPTVIMPTKPTISQKLAGDDDATREMPRPQRAKTSAPAATMPVAAPISTGRQAPTKTQPSKPEQRKSQGRGGADNARPNAKSSAPGETQMLVITDAVRLLNWGRQWHELAELIARIADRPSLPDVRRILRSYRSDIERRAAEPQT